MLPEVLDGCLTTGAQLRHQLKCSEGHREQARPRDRGLRSMRRTLCRHVGDTKDSTAASVVNSKDWATSWCRTAECAFHGVADIAVEMSLRG